MWTFVLKELVRTILGKIATGRLFAFEAFESLFDRFCKAPYGLMPDTAGIILVVRGIRMVYDVLKSCF